MNIAEVEPTVCKDVTWEAWTDGYAVGFKITHHATGAVEYMYLNPSTEYDEDGSPDAFLYQGTEGAPHIDSAGVYFTPILWEG